MNALIVLLYVLVVVTALLLIGLILIQPSKGGGMGAAFGGVGETVLGAHAGSHLTKATVVLTTVFFVTALVLATLIGRVGRDDGAMSNITQKVKNTTTQQETAEAPETAAPKETAPAPAQGGQ